MHKPIYVYSHDANPDIDPPQFRITPADAALRLAKGYVRWLSPDRVQQKPPADWSPNRCETVAGGGIFSNAWVPRFSDSFLVLQLIEE